MKLLLTTTLLSLASTANIELTDKKWDRCVSKYNCIGYPEGTQMCCPSSKTTLQAYVCAPAAKITQIPSGEYAGFIADCPPNDCLKDYWCKRHLIGAKNGANKLIQLTYTMFLGAALAYSL